ncbi:hypothetical protein D3C81_07820 [compost metagenome]
MVEKYKIIITGVPMEFNPIYRRSVESGLKYAYKLITENLNIINRIYAGTETMKINVLQGEVVEAKCYAKGVRTKFVVKRVLNYNELVQEVEKLK